MKKSEIYKMAMASVVRDTSLAMVDTLKVLEVLMADKKMAEFSEEREAEENADLP